MCRQSRGFFFAVFTDVFLFLVGVQRHKLGTNLTPVTRETFAIWKKTRMDKKQAEDEAMKKAKDLQSAAGKSSGMSGRDLVRCPFLSSLLLPACLCSSLFLLSLPFLVL